MTSTQPLRFDQVCLSIDGKELLHNITCQIKPAGKTVIMGPNGAGKSLFLRVLSGLMQPTSGQVEGFGISQNGWGDRICSVVFQKPVLLRRSVFANLAFVLSAQSLSKQQRDDKIHSALTAARLGEKAGLQARRLSGGEQQRLAMARALIVKPDALLLDEPTASLDPASTHIVESMVEEAASNGVKVIFVTHDVKQSKRIADDIVFLNAGRILTHKMARSFFAEPGSEEAQAYLDGRIPGLVAG
jgi:tungstate transport system ATP-binding protein